jgi:FtsH-binding integral membrane protein
MNGESPQSISAAMQQVLHSSQQLFLDRLELWRLELQEGTRTFIQNTVLRLCACLLASTAAVLLTVGLCLYLATLLPAYQAVLLVGSGFLLLSVGLWFAPKAGRVAAQVDQAAAAVQVEAEALRNP